MNDVKTLNKPTSINPLEYIVWNVQFRRFLQEKNGLDFAFEEFMEFYKVESKKNNIGEGLLAIARNTNPKVLGNYMRDYVMQHYPNYPNN